MLARRFATIASLVAGSAYSAYVTHGSNSIFTAALAQLIAAFATLATKVYSTCLSSSTSTAALKLLAMHSAFLIRSRTSA